MKKKRIVIVIPGTKGLSKWPGWIQKIARFLGKRFRFKIVSIDHPEYWKGKIKYRNSKVVWMKWDRGFSRLSKWKARRELKRLLRKYRKHQVKIVGISMAGDIIMRALRELKVENLEKVILVGAFSSNKDIDFEIPPIINIFSRGDKFIQFFIRLFAPIRGGQQLIGRKIKNIHIPSVSHDGFCKNILVTKGKYQGSSITQIINNFLK